MFDLFLTHRNKASPDDHPSIETKAMIQSEAVQR